MKREPLLADLLLSPSRKRWKHTQFEDTCKDNLLMAKRFVLDDTATQYIAEMIRDVPRVIADAQDFAIPPFTRMWVEFPFSTLWETVNGLPSDEHGDQKLGFLIVGNQVRVGVVDKVHHADGAQWVPAIYHLNRPQTYAQQIKFCEDHGISRMGLDELYWGSTINRWYQERGILQFKAGVGIDFNEAPDGRIGVAIQYDDDKIMEPGDEVIGTVTIPDDLRESQRALRANHSIEVLDIYDQYGLTRKDFFQRLIAKNSGDLRNLISILLFLNRTNDVQIERIVGPKQQFIGNKLRPLLKHSVISLKLNPKPRFISMVAGQNETWRKLHDVRGHFCHNERARTSGCLHPDWVETEPRKWTCKKCMGMRWWRSEHKRGHEEKGLVTSIYEVSK